MILNPYRFSAAGGDYLLDTYTGAQAAYSLRVLATAFETADLVIVRRSSGGESSFNATEIADGTMLAWVGTSGTDQASVTTWYDQSGNGLTMTNTTTAQQPKIVINGVQVVSNGEPAIDFDGSNDYLFNTSNLTYNSGLSYYSLCDIDVVVGRFFSDDITGAQGYFYAEAGASGTVRLNDNDTGYELIATGTPALVQELRSFHFDSSTGDYEYAVDGSNTTGNLATWSDVAINSTNTANIAIGGAGNGGQNLNGKMQEFIIYTTDESANRTSIEADINAHYSIY